MDVLAATDFLTAEVWTRSGLVTYYVLFFMHLATRRVQIAGITPYPNEQWMTQVARNVTMADVGFLSTSRYLIHDRDGKFCPAFRATVEAVGVKTVKLPTRSPNLNAFAERWVKSVKDECLSKLILFGEKSLRLALKEYVTHHHHERNHQGKDNLLLFPAAEQGSRSEGPVRCRERLGRAVEILLPEGGMSFFDLTTCQETCWSCDPGNCSRVDPSIIGCRHAAWACSPVWINNDE
jgi:hypothetical protein